MGFDENNSGRQRAVLNIIRHAVTRRYRNYNNEYIVTKLTVGRQLPDTWHRFKSIKVHRNIKIINFIEILSLSRINSYCRR